MLYSGKLLWGPIFTERTVFKFSCFVLFFFFADGQVMHCFINAVISFHEFDFHGVATNRQNHKN